MSISLDDAEKLKELVVQPMVDAVKAEVAPLVKQGQDHEARLQKLEGNQRKALAGYAGVVAAITVAWHAVKAKYPNIFKFIS